MGKPNDKPILIRGNWMLITLEEYQDYQCKAAYGRAMKKAIKEVLKNHYEGGQWLYFLCKKIELGNFGFTWDWARKGIKDCITGKQIK